MKLNTSLLMYSKKSWLFDCKRYALLLAVIIPFITLPARLSAQSSNQVTLNFKHTSLTKVFKSIKNQTGYVFVSGDIDLDKMYVDVHVNKVSINEALTICLKNLDLQYFINDKTIVISRGVTNFTPSGTSSENNFQEVTGIIQGTDGTPLAGASVFVKGAKRGTVAFGKGNFKLTGVSPDDIIVISYTGFITNEIRVNNNPDIGIITMSPQNNKLDEVHILAYGQKTSQRLTTGSSVKITAEDIAKQPVGNVLQALEGRVAGLIITQTSGLPGSDINVQIRGQNSIDPNEGVPGRSNVIKNLPLYIVDGIPFPGAAINQQASSSDANGNYYYLSGPNGNGSPLSTINPNDIESIEILKDANATAIYGSRGANGVILITTKRGKAGKVGVSVGANSGVSIVPQPISVLNLPDYLALRKEAFANDNKTPTTGSAPDLTLWSQTEATDFKKSLLGKPARNLNGNVSVSGGTGGTTFMLSGNYSRQSSIFDDNRSSNTYGAHFSMGYTSDDQRFKLSASAMISNNTSNLANVNFYQDLLSLPPNFPLYDPAGKLYWWNGFPSVSNPLAIFNASYQNKMTTMSSGINLKYLILPGLDLQTNVGYNKTQSSQNSLLPSTAVSPSVLSFFQPSATYAESYTQSFVVEPQINYNTNIGKGIFSALLGGTVQKTVNEQPFYIEATGFSSDLFLTNLSLASTYTVRNGYNGYNYASVFGKVNYIWENKYVIDGNFRRDGSSKFGPNNLYGNFGSVGAAWILTEENWLKKRPEWFSFAKIRSSYGVVGSDGVNNYAFLSTYSNTNGNNYYSGANGLSPARLANPDFKWETTKKFEVSMDFGFFKDRTLLSVAYFNNTTSNQLITQPLPTQTGFAGYVSNFQATVQNTGIELTLTSTNIKSKNFSWSTSANATLPKNKLLSFQGLAQSTYAYDYVVGKSLSSLYLLHYTGVGANGLPTYQDVDKDGVITLSQGYNTGTGDLLYAGKAYPDCYGGLSNTFKYKNLQLDFFFQFTIGATNRGILANLSAPPGGLTNEPTAVVDKIKQLGLSKLFTTSSYSQDFNQFIQSDALLNKLSYGRLTNVSLAYNLPAEQAKHLGLGGLSVHLQAQNLFVFTLSGQKYAGIDPETGPVAVPPLRAIVAGLQLSF